MRHPLNDDETSRRHPRHRRKGLLWLGAIAMLATVFVGGAFVGRWAVKNQVVPRLRAALNEALNGAEQAGKDADAAAEWASIATHLVRLESTEVHLPGSAEGWGGGLQAMEDGRLFYASRSGEFGIVGRDRIAHPLPFRIELNEAALKTHPVSGLSNFNPLWFRVTDFDLRPLGNGRFELVVGHHYFDAPNDCVQLRLSRAEIVERDGRWSLAVPFEVLLTASPCITFNHPDHQWAFEGHFSGGRIARLQPDELLFSTGDHGWWGLRGYPAVSADADSTLGKILRVDLARRTVEVFASGVRNPQGLHIDSRGRIWETEHGPRGGDELNLIEPGRDFGWPWATLGTDYGPGPWPHNRVQGRHDRGISPRYAWVPSIGVSNVLEVRGDEFPLWKGDLLVLSLVGQSVHRLRLEDDRVVYDEPIRFEGHRLRDAAELPDGRIALLSDRGLIILLRNGDRVAGAAPYLDPAAALPLTETMTAAERAAAVAGRYAAGRASDSQETTSASIQSAPGKSVYDAYCASCHAIHGDTAGVGPSLQDIAGRPIGSAAYAYSAALAAATGRWTAERAVEFAVDPQALYPGTAMKPVPLTAEQRLDLKQYLDSMRD